MKTLHIGWLLLLLFGAVRVDAENSPSVTYAGGDGSSTHTAIIIIGPASDGAATSAEYAYLRRHFPHYRMIMQSLLHSKGKSYELLKFRDDSGKIYKIYFDVAGTLGKHAHNVSHRRQHAHAST